MMMYKFTRHFFSLKNGEYVIIGNKYRGTYLKLSAECYQILITIGVLVVFLQYCVKFITPLENMILLKVSLNMIKPSLNRIDDIFTGSNPSDKKRTINDIEEIQLENVTFGYEEEQKVIKNADLSFKKNRKYLICGKSGIGKSTIINLILGFWNPNCGKILINGIDIKEYDIEQVRDRISIVSQKTFFYMIQYTITLQMVM